MRCQIRTKLMIAAGLLPLVSFASAGLAQNPVRGEQLARTWCAGCHVVTSGQEHVVTEVPSFRSIAQRKDFDRRSVAYFLLAPHPPMPNLSLTRSEAADLAAYIESQKQVK
ncbi:MAG TPA: c-type cytochrome [Rhizomicrobium sp.]|nr:c-type cytochrome [Rhizomicrobium sp.]